MPISIALPPANVEWVSQFFGPLAGGTGGFQALHGNTPAGGSAVAALTYVGARPPQGREAWMQNTSGSGAGWNGWAGFASVPSFPQWALRLGRTCMRDRSGGAFNAVSFLPGDWAPDFRGSPLVVPTGSLQDDASVVGVFDFHISCSLAGAPPWADDQVGWFFLPEATGLSCGQVPGFNGFANKVGGFGIFLNNSGAGTTVLEYLSWGNGVFPAVPTLERIRVPLNVAPNVTNWNSVRFIIIGARPGFGAQLTVQVNRQDVLPVRLFGSPELNEPTTSVASAAGFVCGFAIASFGGVQPDVWTQYHVKLGRFTPGGAELQTP